MYIVEKIITVTVQFTAQVDRHLLYTCTWRCTLLGYFYVSFQGITTYFSGNCTLKDAEIAQEFLTEKVRFLFFYTFL